MLSIRAFSLAHITVPAELRTYDQADSGVDRARTDGERRRERSRSMHQYRALPGAREGDRVAHVGEAGDVGEGALEAEPEAGARHRAVAAQVAVPGIVLPVDAALGHAAVQSLEPLLALAAADDLTDPGRQHVQR